MKIRIYGKKRLSFRISHIHVNNNLTTKKSVRTLNTGKKSSEVHQITEIRVFKRKHKIFKSLRWIFDKVNLGETITFHTVRLYIKSLTTRKIEASRFSFLNSYIYHRGENRGKGGL